MMDRFLWIFCLVDCKPKQNLDRIAKESKLAGMCSTSQWVAQFRKQQKNMINRGMQCIMDHFQVELPISLLK